MQKKERDLVLTIFKNLFNSLKPRKFTGELKGTDHFGNKYFEIPADDNRNKRARYFEPIGKEDGFDREVPAEWEAWLRGRRKDPPAEEEVIRNYNLALEKKKKALEIEEMFKGTKEKLPALGAAKGKDSFPEYPEYELAPGTKNPKWKSEN
ncbi:NADH dehydrogenase [ubiquinone] 1 alpha subcomplex assembly factor 2 [Macrosteles quadrilineatus]|uniref:NADH dehydrogenase [ubiquinone] 1 alpha subcomplex assembly factor 2 n=1 Tax=Macrosteles quadrilineatus TaxID=74068 RepID=UPI0023E0BAC2|nr:NADH dehydrogenase [ubiquinone] 1 alpha subcomplex assembly factor 2 [Macrosteles quadrilineatus]